MRAIDYILTRPEVDPKRIACAGHSGGGTLTLFISAIDERVACAVVNEGGTTHRWPLEIRPESRIGPATSSRISFPPRCTESICAICMWPSRRGLCWP